MSRPFTLLFVLFFIGCTSFTNTLIDGMFVTSTEDGYTIAGTVYKSHHSQFRSDEAVLLIHSLGNSQSEWTPEYISGLQYNFTLVTMDLRGHGSSSGVLSQLTAEDYPNMILDVKAVVSYLKAHGITKISIIGSDLGANLALTYAVTDNDVKKLLLISPTQETKGVATLEPLRKYKGELYIFMSRDYQKDWDYGLYMRDKFTGEKKLRLVENGGHGAESFLQNRFEDTLLFTDTFLRR